MSAGQQFPLSPLTTRGINELHDKLRADAASHLAISTSPFDAFDLRHLEAIAVTLRALHQRGTLDLRARGL